MDDTPRLSAEELHRFLPDLQTLDALPPIWFVPQFGTHIPYQVVGVGLGVDLYPVSWLRLSGLYYFGFSPKKNDVTASSYAEASIGVRVLHVASQVAVDITTRAIPNAPPVVIKGSVPSYHGLFLEGGLLTGFFAPGRCVANCDIEFATPQLVDDSRQLWSPFAGLRYIYFYQASSKRVRFNERKYLQVYAHVLHQPFNTFKHDIYSWKHEKLDRDSWGARVGVDLPPPHVCVADLVLHTGCAQGGIAVGYNPVPGFVFFEFHVSYLVD